MMDSERSSTGRGEGHPPSSPYTRTFRLVVAMVASVSLLSVSTYARASTGPDRPRSDRDSTRRTEVWIPERTQLAPSDVESLFEDLEAVEDPSLASHEASGLSDTELILTVVFLIVLFPVGVILLIIFLLDDE